MGQLPLLPQSVGIRDQKLMEMAVMSYARPIPLLVNVMAQFNIVVKSSDIRSRTINQGGSTLFKEL